MKIKTRRTIYERS